MMQIDLSLLMQTGSNLPMLIGLRSLKLIDLHLQMQTQLR